MLAKPNKPFHLRCVLQGWFWLHLCYTSNMLKVCILYDWQCSEYISNIVLDASKSLCLKGVLPHYTQLSYTDFEYLTRSIMLIILLYLSLSSTTIK